MGLYINPPDRSKEEWLKKHGVQVGAHTKWENFDQDSLPVVLVNNGLFTAAGVAYCEREYKEFLEDDGRPKIVFSVTKKDIMAVTGGELETYLLKV